MEKDVVFKRLNFFRGFLTTEKDWNDGEMYHILKRRMHNRALHSPGVVRHFLGGLRVTQRDRGDLSVVISPGYAIDGQGRDIYLSQPVIKQINPEDFKLPATVYVVIRYAEEPTDFIAYKENPLFKGHRRIAEYAKIEVLPTVPDIDEEVELARIFLQPDAKAIRDPIDPDDPRPNEIDMRFVPLAGVAGSFLTSEQRQELREFLTQQIEAYLRVGHELKVETALDVAYAFLQLRMLLGVDAVNTTNLFDLMDTVLMLQHNMIVDIEAHHPKIDREKFSLYRQYIEGITLKYKDPAEGWKHLLYNEGLAAKQLMSMLPKGVKKKKKGDDLMVLLERVKKVSTEFPKLYSLGSIKLQMVDMLDIYNEDSEREHGFRIHNPEERYRSRQRLKYPDEQEVEDVGVHYRGGSAEWTINNVTPGKRVILIRRINVVRGNFAVSIEVNGRQVGTMEVNESDIDHRWRNWPFVIPAEFVDAPTLRIKETPIKSDRDINIYKIWVYQEM